MMKLNSFCVWILSLAGLISATPCQGSRQETANATVTQLDIKRFMGKWYEIARFDHRFEKGMTHVTAEYTLQPDGKIRVVNRGLKNGKPKEITGKARQPDPIKHPGELEVSFFLWFYSDYDILELGDNYQYAVIGGDSDKYLWILSRTPQMPQETLTQICSRLAQRGYNLSKLIYIDQ